MCDLRWPKVQGFDDFIEFWVRFLIEHADTKIEIFLPYFLCLSIELEFSLKTRENRKTWMNSCVSQSSRWRDHRGSRGLKQLTHRHWLTVWKNIKFTCFRMKFLEYTDSINYGDLVILYISTEDLKQIKVTKDQTYQTKFG